MSYVPYVNPHGLVITTQWRDLVNGQRTFLFAGARQDTSGANPDASQGLVIVQTYSIDLSNFNSIEYEAPGRIGMLYVTEAESHRVTLTSQTGKSIYFDVMTRQFVDDLSAKVTLPTITPLPSLTSTSRVPIGYPLPETFQAYPP
jgi:hypothetical protein